MTLGLRRRRRASPEEVDEDIDLTPTSGDNTSSSASNYSESPKISRDPRRRRRKPWGPAQKPQRAKKEEENSTQATAVSSAPEESTEVPEDSEEDSVARRASLIVQLPVHIVNQDISDAEAEKRPLGGLRDLGGSRKRRRSTDSLPSVDSPDDNPGGGTTQEQTRRDSQGRRGSKFSREMAPGYRANNRRQNRTGQNDHDMYEGLPVRQWRRDYVTVVPPPTQDNTTSQNDIWAVELPHGMPKDYHLLPQHSQDLLRAARSGKIYKRPVPVEEEEADPEILLGDKPEKKEEDPKDKGFTAKAWKPVPRHAEAPEFEYLAKRRKGVITAAPRSAVVGTLTKTKVKRIDAAGNEYVQDVVLPHGQPVEGEVISQTVIPDPSAVTDPYAVQPTPKRKGQAPKKRPKGPGRGRKKKQVAPTSVPEETPVASAPPADGTAAPTDGSDAIKIEEGVSAVPPVNEDTEMADGSVAASDDEDDGDDGEEGEEEEGSVEPNISPSKSAPVPSPPPSALPATKTIPPILEHSRPALIQIERADVKSGSPLKNVALTQSTLTSPLDSPATAGTFPDLKTSTPPQPSIEPAPEAATTSLPEEPAKQEPEKASPSLSPPPPATVSPEAEAKPTETKPKQEEDDGDAMVLDIAENADNAETVPPAALAAEEEAPIEKVPSPVNEKSASSDEVPAASHEEKENEDDDYLPDLLDGLEKSLEKPKEQQRDEDA